MHKLLTSAHTTDTKEAVTTLGGIRVLALKVSDGSTDYVTDTSSPQFAALYLEAADEFGLPTTRRSGIRSARM